MYNNNINEIHKFPSFVFGEINSHQTWGVQMGTIRGYSVHKPRNISRDYPPTHCWLKRPFQGKQAAPPLQPLKRWKTQTLGALETTLNNIRNRIILFTYSYIYIHILWDSPCNLRVSGKSIHHQRPDAGVESSVWPFFWADKNFEMTEEKRRM